MGSKAHRRALAKRVRLNRQILDNPYWFLPVDDKGHENYTPVGRGVKSSDFCGAHVGFDVCKDVEAHQGIVKNGVDYTDTIAVRHKHLWCKNAQCVTCFVRGWSVRRARVIEARLSEAVERGFGDVEHIVVSAPKEDYNLSETALRKKARRALSVRGITGGCSIFHGFRIDKRRKVLTWGSHYHVLGFLDGGFDRCRNCTDRVCEGYGNEGKCDGFEAVTRREFKKDGYIVRVLAKRKSLFGTGWYQVHHSTLRLGIKRFHVVNWFGRVAYNNFKSGGLEVKAEVPCFICGGEMTKHVYVGRRRIAKNIGDVDYQPWFAVPVAESEDFVEVTGSRDYG